MNRPPSLADSAVAALAAVSAMDEGIDTNHPRRHEIWTLKRIAQSLISDALRQATELTYTAAQLVKEQQ